MRGPRSRSRWLSTGLSAALLGLLILSLPLYAGGTPLEGFSWRMEHGRLSLVRSDLERVQPLWVAFNSEGLRWAPRVRIHGTDDWCVVLPLWMPLLGALVWCAGSWRRAARHSPNSEATSSA